MNSGKACSADGFIIGPVGTVFNPPGRLAEITIFWVTQNSLGDSKFAYIVSFGSYHPTIVNTVRADGSTNAVARSVTLDVWYAYCGQNDGRVLPFD